MESILQVKFFQREVSSVISDVPGSANSQNNNFIVWRKTLQEQDNNLRKVFLKISESGLKLDKTKHQVRKKMVAFLEQKMFSTDRKGNPPNSFWSQHAFMSIFMVGDKF